MERKKRINLPLYDEDDEDDEDDEEENEDEDM